MNTHTPQPTPRIRIVGIGASAGGIDALQTLFVELPGDLGVAYAVVVHLDPEHASELPRILSTRTAMKVMHVEDATPIRANTIYVIPPNKQLLINDESISVAPFKEPRGQRAPIDFFFRSLAEQHGDGFAIVLSGGGSDGAIGVRAIKEGGGIILVQDPVEAEFKSMPRNAIASGADFVLPIRELARQLVALVATKSQVTPESIEEGAEDTLRRVLSHLRSKTGQDFSRYKRATLLRRLARRMQVAQSENLGDYLNYLRDHNNEVEALLKDLLISVTSFFRDPEAFDALAQSIIPRLFEQELRESVVRVWVPACATGEEAYSVAILLLEEASRHDTRPDIQVFATDLDTHALDVAREGRYTANISADVSNERLRRFFLKEGDQYRVRRELRDLIVFASHSVLKDPPFSRLNLISCRNLLIYLDRDLQQQVCSILHYALLPHGFLFLGTSETAESPPGLFAVLDREARIYAATEPPHDRLPPLPRLMTAVRSAELLDLPQRRPSAASVDISMHRVGLEELAPPSLLVDETHTVVNLSENCGRFLLHSSGPIVTDAAEIVRPELRLELRAALHRAFENDEATVTLPIPVAFNGSTHAVVLCVRPLKRQDAPRTALVFFIEGGAVTPLGGNGDEPSAAVAQLREELHSTRTVLRTTREEYEATTEELRAANEELQSINEEYRSTAEELETSKEELQSINEELQTLNNELKLKLDLVSRAHNDLQNLMAATDVSTMFLDSNLRIVRFTPRVAELFSIAVGDEGRSVSDFTHRLKYQELNADALKVLADLTPIERTVQTTAGRWFLMRLRPYRTLDDKIDGIVATFVDVTERREAEAAWEARQSLLIGELDKRVDATLSVAKSILERSLESGEVSQEQRDLLKLRIDALARAHVVVAQNEWRGADLESLARRQLEPYLLDNRLQLSGPEAMLPPALAMTFGIALFELAANATKDGAFSAPDGRVRLTWRIEQNPEEARRLTLTWTESGGPPPSHAASGGASLDLLERAIPGAEVERRLQPAGLVFTIAVALPETTTHRL